MARTPTSIDSEVETYVHPAAKRRNIPTAEMQGLAPDDEKAVKTLRYPRNPDLDPQLVWRGKDAEDAADLEVLAPPIYIQEKIHSKAIIADLKRRSARGSPDPDEQVDLFHDFNGLPDPEARTEFYAHDQNWSNRMILGDSLMVMASLAEREALRGKVQMIYLDPPYGIKFNSNWQPSTRSFNVSEDIKSMTREPEVIRAFRDTWKNGISSYLSYLRDRLVLSRDLLNENGSVFVQIGDENVHLVRAVMDEVFGSNNFVSMITVQKSGSGHTVYLAGVSDFVLWYSKNIEITKFRDLYKERTISVENSDRFNIAELETGERISLKNLVPGAENVRLIAPDPIQSASQGREKGEGASNWFPVRFQGKEYRPNEKRRWSTNEIGFRRIIRANRVIAQKTTIRFAKYSDDFAAVPLTNIWNDIGGAAGRIYVVQTTERIIERCMLMATDPGDLVIDPTCGSGTTAYVAEQWGRRWITIDTSRVALALARTRLMSGKFDWYHLRDTPDGSAEEAKLTGQMPSPGPFNCDLRHGFVYKRLSRIGLNSVVKNAGIDEIWERWQSTLEPLRERLNNTLGKSWEEWSIPRNADDKWPAAVRTDHAAWWQARRDRQAEIDASIASNVEVELLYDRPLRAKGVVRVSGPFTVESLSPHRVLPLGEDPFLAEALLADGETEAAQTDEPLQTDFAQVVYENLKAAGVQNTKKGGAISFDWLRPFASKRGYIAFEGQYEEAGETRRAAVAIGPEYDTVGYDMVRNAAREAMDAFDTLIVCGFAFAPEIDDSRLNFGRMTVLKARMNQDLRMADRLKATGAGNLFVVFGEPDIAVETLADGQVRIEIRGVDIFDPTTGEVRSSKDPAEDIACWFIDDDYDEESFFVRQAYFLGRDPYESLKRALKAEIDEAAWSELNSTVSRPFAKPDSGRVCVKVINHFGDEVQKVFSV